MRINILPDLLCGAIITDAINHRVLNMGMGCVVYFASSVPFLLVPYISAYPDNPVVIVFGDDTTLTILARCDNALELFTFFAKNFK